MLVKEVAFANQNITSELSIGTFIPACDCTVKVRCDLGTTGDLLVGEAANFTFTAYITRESTAIKVFDSGALAKPTAANTRYSHVLNSSFTLKAGETLDIKALSSLAGDSSVGGSVKFFDEYDAGSEPQLHVHSSGLDTATGFSKAGAKLLVASAVTAGADGDTILVWPGAYPVSITANKSINLIGMHRKGCLVTATGSAGPTCTLSDYGAVVENFTLTSAANSSAASGTLYLSSACNTARHLDIVLTASAVDKYGILCVSSAVKTRSEDIYLTSDASGILIDGSDFVGKDLTILCTNARSGVPIGVKNQGVWTRLNGCTIYVMNNQDNASAGATGFENDTTNGSDTCILSDCFIQVVNEHVNGAAATSGIIAETPMILQNCDINVRNDGAGATYGLKADDDVLLVNCRIKLTASTDYSIAVATGKTVKCLNCQYDHDAISVTGTGAVIDVIDANGRVDVATANGAALLSAADVVNEWETQSQAAPAGFQVNVMQLGSDAQSATDLKDFADTGYNPSTHKVTGVVLTDTVTTLTGHTAQTGDSYAIVAHADYGNAKLVRSTTPAYALDVSSTGEAGLDFANIKNATGATTLTNITVPTVTSVTNEVSADMIKLKSNGDAATDLSYFAQFFMANEAEDITDFIANGSILSKILCVNGTISNFADGTDSLEAMTNKVTAVDDYIDTEVTAITKLLEADAKVDKTTDPAAWRIKYYEKGTSNVLLTKLIKTVDGVAILSEYTVIGQQLEV